MVTAITATQITINKVLTFHRIIQFVMHCLIGLGIQMGMLLGHIRLDPQNLYEVHKYGKYGFCNSYLPISHISP